LFILFPFSPSPTLERSCRGGGKVLPFFFFNPFFFPFPFFHGHVAKLGGAPFFPLFLLEHPAATFFPSLLWAAQRKKTTVSHTHSGNTCSFFSVFFLSFFFTKPTAVLRAGAGHIEKEGGLLEQLRRRPLFPLFLSPLFFFFFPQGTGQYGKGQWVPRRPLFFFSFSPYFQKRELNL